MNGAGQMAGASRAVDFGAAGIFAGATGYSVLIATAASGPAVAAAAASFVAAKLVMSRVDGPETFSLPEFAVPPAEAEEDALLLTELAELLLTDVLGDDSDDHSGELLLEDRLEQLGNDSRVIRLFDPRSLPTAGEMHERIEEHLRDAQAAAYPDATAELHRALSDLRTSLR